MTMSEPVILEVARTPFAKRNGAFRETRPDVLLAHVLRGLAKRAGIDAAQDRRRGHGSRPTSR